MLPRSASVRGWAALALLTVSASVARAVPADAHLRLAPGTEKFLEVDFRIEGVFARPAGAVHVEAMPAANEVFVRVPPDAPADVVVFAYSAYRVHAWTVCAAEDEASCTPATDPLLAAKACPGFGPAKEDGQPVWQGVVKDEKCLAALLKHLRHAHISARDLRLVMEESAARAFYGGILSAVAKDPAFATIKVAFMGPTLTVRGKTTRATLESLLHLAWQRTAASVSFDADDLEIEPTPQPTFIRPAPARDLLPAPEDDSGVRIIEVP